MITKQHIQITAKLDKCQVTAKRFFGEEYAQKIKPFAEKLKIVMNSNNCNAIQALLKISETPEYLENGVYQMLYMAAVVDELDKKAEKLNPDNLSLDKAKIALRCGKKLSHKNMMPGEWVKKINPNTLITEDGFEIEESLFWKDRSNESWETGWRIVN